jgi:hypothetical protein
MTGFPNQNQAPGQQYQQQQQQQQQPGITSVVCLIIYVSYGFVFSTRIFF